LSNVDAPGGLIFEIADYLKNHLSGVDAEIIEYLKNHTEPKDCSVTQMIKAGAVRKNTALSRTFLKKHLVELEERGFIFSFKVCDPIRKIEYTYYTLKPTCIVSKKPGTPKKAVKKVKLDMKILQEYYSNIKSMYIPLIFNYCGLCNELRKNLPKKDWSCVDFLLTHNAIKGNDPDDLKEEDITPKEAKNLRKKVDDWHDEQWQNPQMWHTPPIFLEDLTITLVGYCLYMFYVPACVDCKSYVPCLNKSQKWVNELLSEHVNYAVESDLTRFWKSLLSGTPEIKTELLENYILG